MDSNVYSVLHCSHQTQTVAETTFPVLFDPPDQVSQSQLSLRCSVPVADMVPYYRIIEKFCQTRTCLKKKLCTHSDSQYEGASNHEGEPSSNVHNYDVS